MEQQRETFAQWFRRQRESARLTPTQLGRRSGVGASYVTKIEMGVVKRPGKAKWEVLAKELGISRSVMASAVNGVFPGEGEEIPPLPAPAPLPLPDTIAMAGYAAPVLDEEDMRALDDAFSHTIKQLLDAKKRREGRASS